MDKELQKAILAVMLKKDTQVDEAKKPLHPNQQKIDVHEPEKDEITSKDFEMLRSGKKAKPMKEEEQVEEGTYKPEVEKAFPSSGVKMGAPAPKGTSTMPKDKEKAKGQSAGRMNAKIQYGMKEEIEIGDDADETILIHTPINFELAENYMFGDYLTAAKDIVGDEKAIELANYAFNNNDTNIFVEQFMRSDIEDKVKTHQKAGHKVSMPKYSTKSGKPYAEYVVTDKESGVRRKYIHHGNARSIENMGAAGKRDE
jgi:hypothetical protein